MAARSIPILILTLCYPLWQGFQLNLAGNDPQLVFEALQNYRISIWLVWVVWAAVAVWHKWTQKNNRFFKSTYIYIIITSIVYGFFHSRAIELTGYPSSFSDSYTTSVLASLLDAAALSALTGFLQGSVWWFTRRPHRK